MASCHSSRSKGLALFTSTPIGPSAAVAARQQRRRPRPRRARSAGSSAARRPRRRIASQVARRPRDWCGSGSRRRSRPRPARARWRGRCAAPPPVTSAARGMVAGISVARGIWRETLVPGRISSSRRRTADRLRWHPPVSLEGAGNDASDSRVPKIIHDTEANHASTVALAAARRSVAHRAGGRAVAARCRPRHRRSPASMPGMPRSTASTSITRRSAMVRRWCCCTAASPTPTIGGIRSRH